MARVTSRAPSPPLHRPLMAGVSLVALCAMILGASLLPVPYVIESPGPAIDVLGDYQDEKILTIDGGDEHPTYPTDGELMMTTVSVDGGPGYRVTPIEVLLAWFDRSQAVMPRELLYPEDQSAEESSLETSVQMSTSQQDAVAVALDELEIPYEDTVIVAGVEKGGPAQDVLKPGDRVLAINGSSAADTAGYQELAAATPAGQDVEVTVQRGEERTTLEVPTEQVDGKPRMGIVLAAGHDFPIDVGISVGDVGGPSAGTMFALSVYDELTPGALTGGQDVAGTGTIDEAGEVGAIGGIRQKMVGARDAGADYFLAPADNCDEVTGYVPEGLHVVKVATFDDALHAVETIGTQKSADGLPTCG